jgi:flagellin-specific chaperone FliS
LNLRNDLKYKNQKKLIVNLKKIYIFLLKKVYDKNQKKNLNKKKLLNG